MSTIDGSMRIPEKNIQPAIGKKPEVAKEEAVSPAAGDKVTIGQKLAGIAVGLAAAPVGAVVNATTGGAEGAVKAGGVKNEFLHTELWRGLTGIGMMVAGHMILGPVGALTGLLGGVIAWDLQGHKISEKVMKNADKAVKHIVGEEKPDNRTFLHKISDGALGYTVGAVSGAATGAKEWFKAGEKLGEKIAKDISEK